MSKERRSRGGRGGDIRRSTCWRREDVRKTDGVKVRGGRARSGPVTPKEERERERQEVIDLVFIALNLQELQLQTGRDGL